MVEMIHFESWMSHDLGDDSYTQCKLKRKDNAGTAMSWIPSKMAAEGASVFILGKEYTIVSTHKTMMPDELAMLTGARSRDGRKSLGGRG